MEKTKNIGRDDAEQSGELNSALAQIAPGAGDGGAIIQPDEGVVFDIVAQCNRPRLERILEVVDRALYHAKASVVDIVQAGMLLNEQSVEVAAALNSGESEQTWGEWLDLNCPQIHRVTAFRWMKAAAYYNEHKHLLGFASIRELYLKSGTIKEPESEGRLRTEQSILDPAFGLWDKFKRTFTDDFIEKLDPLPARSLLGWIKDAKLELDAMQKRVTKKLEAAK